MGRRNVLLAPPLSAAAGHGEGRRRKFLHARNLGLEWSAMNPPLTRITADPGVCSGQPCVRGLRLPVSVVLKYLAAGRSSAEVIDEFPELEPDDISECLRHAAWLASGRTVALPSAA